MLKHALTLLLLLATINFISDSRASAISKISEDDQKVIINALSKKFINYYTDPALAKKVAKQLLLNINNNEYLGYDELWLFADRITEDIYEITQDKHVRVKLRQPETLTIANKTLNNEFNQVDILKGNVGMIKFDRFSSDPQAKNHVNELFKTLSDVDALIIDLRENRGGSPDLVRYISSYFFDKKTHLNSIFWRENNRHDEYWTIDNIEGEKRPKLPIYILTSKDTFSAAEEFTYNLKVRKRAYIVGETTKGGANPGRFFELPEQLSIFIPTGRAINPITQTNWEGVGVVPDLPVISVKAYEEAYALAKFAAIEYRVKQGRASTEEKYSNQPTKKTYGKWQYAKNSCPLKYRWAQAEYNETTNKYQFPYQIKYYGNSSAKIRYQLGNKSGKMTHTQYFKNRTEEKSGISIGFSSPENFYMSKCKIIVG